MNRLILFVFFLLFGNFVSAQSTEKWSLMKCYQYALANNISIKQTDLQSRFSALTYKQSTLSKYPNANFQGNVGYGFGRSENPVTGVLEDQNIFSNSFGFSTQVSLFNWFSKRNKIDADRISHEADVAQIKKVQDDIALNIAVAYLQILLGKEQTNLASVQIKTTQEQLYNTRKRVDAGALPELNAAELEAQLARDSSAYVTADANVQQLILQMKALLNLDAAASFDVEIPPVDKIPVMSLGEMQPDAVYQLALTSLPQQKINELRLQSAQKMAASARGVMYPTFSGFVNLNTRYGYSKIPLYQQVQTGYTNSGARTNVGGTYYNVEVPAYAIGNKIGNVPLRKYVNQLRNNLGENVGIGVSVPIFNSGSARINWEKAKLNIKQFELTKDLDNQTLKQNIYRAYNDAVAAMQKFNADKKTVETSEKALGFSQKRYDLNLLSTLELITSQNNLLRAKIQSLYSQYDFLFKMKLLEFYRGQGIKL
jgi:outer membrane protein